MTMYIFSIIFVLSFIIKEVVPLSCASATLTGTVYFLKGPLNMTFSSATSYCASVGGYLPVFATTTEMTNFKTFANTTGYKQVWIGYNNYDASHSISSPGIWKSNNGTGATPPTMNWDATQPNNNKSPTPQYCIIAELTSGWEWNDIWCSYNYSVVCMCPAPTTTSTSTTTTTTSTTTPTTTTTSTTTPTTTTTSTKTPTTTTSGTSVSNVSFSTSSAVISPATTTSTTTTPTTTPVTTTSTTSSTAKSPTITTTTTIPVQTTLVSSTNTSTTRSTSATSSTTSTRGTTPSTTVPTTAALTATVTYQCSCENGGFCANIESGDLTCTCVGNWINSHCTKYGWPKDAAGIASFVAQMTGCSVVVALLSLTVGVYVIARDKLPQPVLIFLGDLSILIAHVLIYTCRAPFIADLSDVSCRLVSLFVQLFVLSHFAFLVLQSLHAYSLTTNVNTGGWWPLPVWLCVILGFGLPAIIMGVSAALYFNQFNLAWDCLINYSSSSNYFFLLPSIVMCIATVILSEAAGIDSRDRKRLLLQSKKEWVSAEVGQRSSVVIFIFSLLAIIFTTQAMFHLNVYLSTAAFAMNVAFGIFVFFFHCLENTRIRSLLTRAWNIIKCKSSTTHHNNTVPLTWYK